MALFPGRPGFVLAGCNKERMVRMVQVRQWVPRAPFSMSKMCAMDRRGGAGDVGDVDSATRQHELTSWPDICRTWRVNASHGDVEDGAPNRGARPAGRAVLCGSSEKVWPPCSFLNKEPSKPTVWLPCSGHVQEQKRLPPRLANDSTRGLHGRHLLWGFMLRACLCGVRARVAAGSCNEANMTLRVVPACACAACVPMCSLHVPPVLPCSC